MSSECENKKSYLVASVIIDLCMNFAMENSINVTTTYSQSNGEIDSIEFARDFARKLNEYWILYEKNNHIFLKNAQIGVLAVSRELPPWKSGANRFKKIESIPCKKWIENQTWKWGIKLTLYMVLLLLINGGYILMFSVINDGVEGLVLAFDATEKISIIDFNGIWGQALKNTVNLILLSVISDRIYKIFGIPDIMESIRSIFGFWESGIRILSWKVKTLYRNL